MVYTFFKIFEKKYLPKVKDLSYYTPRFRATVFITTRQQTKTLDL